MNTTFQGSRHQSNGFGGGGGTEHCTNEEPRATHTNHVGRFVFIENADPKIYTIIDGEYFVVRQTPCALYVVKLHAGYTAHVLSRVVLVGSMRVNLLDSYYDEAAARIGIADMKHFSEKPKRGEAVSWAEGLYASVGENARMAERALDENLQKLRPPVKEEVQRLARITVFSDGYVELDK